MALPITLSHSPYTVTYIACRLMIHAEICVGNLFYTTENKLILNSRSIKFKLLHFQTSQELSVCILQLILRNWANHTWMIMNHCLLLNETQPKDGLPASKTFFIEYKLAKVQEFIQTVNILWPKKSCTPMQQMSKLCMKLGFRCKKKKKRKKKLGFLN